MIKVGRHYKGTNDVLWYIHTEKKIQHRSFRNWFKEQTISIYYILVIDKKFGYTLNSFWLSETEAVARLTRKDALRLELNDG